MENKLAQLTEKLLVEGLEKGRTQSEELIAGAKIEAQRILDDAQQRAVKIAADADMAAQELRRNTANEVRLASMQTLSSLRAQIQTMIVQRVVEPQVSQLWSSGEFVRGLIVDAIGRWSPTKDAAVAVIMPQGCDSDLRGAMAQIIGDGIEVVYDGKLRVPFRIAPCDGSYYVSFTDDDFAQLIKQAIRPKTAQIIFGDQQ